MTGVEYLQTLHTKQLLNLKNEYPRYLIRCGFVNCEWNNTIIHVTYDEWKQVMSERPHIPRQLQARRIRQNAAKFKVRA
jgi:hypothetical protein